MLRRQAHEALVHRVDAEQTAGLPVTDPGVALAADGVDEMLGVMVSGLRVGHVHRDGSKLGGHLGRNVDHERRCGGESRRADGRRTGRQVTGSNGGRAACPAM